MDHRSEGQMQCPYDWPDHCSLGCHSQQHCAQLCMLGEDLKRTYPSFVSKHQNIEPSLADIFSKHLKKNNNHDNSRTEDS